MFVSRAMRRTGRSERRSDRTDSPQLVKSVVMAMRSKSRSMPGPAKTVPVFLTMQTRIVASGTTDWLRSAAADALVSHSGSAGKRYTKQFAHPASFGPSAARMRTGMPFVTRKRGENTPTHQHAHLPGAQERSDGAADVVVMQNEPMQHASVIVTPAIRPS